MATYRRRNADLRSRGCGRSRGRGQANPLTTSKGEGLGLSNSRRVIIFRGEEPTETLEVQVRAGTFIFDLLDEEGIPTEPGPQAIADPPKAQPRDVFVFDPSDEDTDPIGPSPQGEPAESA